MIAWRAVSRRTTSRTAASFTAAGAIAVGDGAAGAEAMVVAETRQVPQDLYELSRIFR